MCSKPNILVTGASGFIGGHVVSCLKEQGLSYKILKRGNNFLDDGENLTIDYPEGIKQIDFFNFSSVIYLSYAQVKQTQSEEDIYKSNIYPFKLLLEQIAVTNPKCGVVFISSFSSSQVTKSKYGLLKYNMEELLKKSNLQWTILVPGLVYSSNTNKGLYGKISLLLRYCPIIPVPYSKDRFIQPVSVLDIARACVEVAGNTNKYIGKVYFLAGDRIRFYEFIKAISHSLKKKRIFVPISDFFIFLFLGILEKLQKNPSFTRTNYLGLVSSKFIDCGESWKELNIKPLNLEEGLLSMKQEEQEFFVDPSYEAKRLFKYLFNSDIPEIVLKRYLECYPKFFNNSNTHSKINLKYIF